MQIRDFAKSMMRKLEEIVKQTEKYNLDRGKYVALASQRSINQARELLQRYLHSKAKADETTLAPFIKQLATYAALVEDTPALFPYNRHTHANKFYWELAQALSPFTGKSAYQLFWPSLEINRDCDYDVPLDRVVKSDDNKTIIDVLAVFELGRAKQVWQHTHPVNDRLELSETEKDRVINFTHHTRRYYDDIMQNKSTRQLNKDKNDMLKNLGYVPLHATYGELGEARLAVRLYPKRPDMTAQDLFSYLADYKGEMRSKYLANFNNQELEKIITQGKRLEDVVAKKMFFTGKEKHDSAVIFSYLTLYRQQLTARNNAFKSFLGWASGYGIAKSYKDVAATILYDLMIANVALADIEAKAIEKINTDISINPNDKPFLLRSLKQGSLGLIVSEMTRVSHPEHEVKPTLRKLN